MARIRYSRMTFVHSSSFSPSPFSVSSPSSKTSFFLFFLLILINIQASSFYTLEEGEFGGESEKSFNSLDFYSPSLGGRESDQDPLMPGMSKGHCDTLTSKVHVTKEEKDENGLVYRTCEGDLTVSKCEGTCNSQLHPSVASPTGFKKDCLCCRESKMVTKEVELTKCFDADGTRITDPMKGTILVRMEEPEGCECHKCGLN